jgi:hypothetical protein
VNEFQKFIPTHMRAGCLVPTAVLQSRRRVDPLHLPHDRARYSNKTLLVAFACACCKIEKYDTHCWMGMLGVVTVRRSGDGRRTVRDMFYDCECRKLVI